MRFFITLLLCSLTTLPSFSQDNKIDSIVAANEANVVTIYQKSEKNNMVSSHALNEDRIWTAYRYISRDVLSSISVALYTGIDTSFKITYYFNSDQLIKVRTESYLEKTRRPDDVFYYRDGIPINPITEINGPYPAEKYVSMAGRHLKLLKKKPVRFPKV